MSPGKTADDRGSNPRPSIFTSRSPISRRFAFAGDTLCSTSRSLSGKKVPVARYSSCQRGVGAHCSWAIGYLNRRRVVALLSSDYSTPTMFVIIFCLYPRTKIAFAIIFSLRFRTTGSRTLRLHFEVLLATRCKRYYIGSNTFRPNLVFAAESCARAYTLHRIMTHIRVCDYGQQLPTNLTTNLLRFVISFD